METNLSESQKEFSSKQRADEEWFGTSELMFGMITLQLTNLGKSSKTSVPRVEKSSYDSRKNECTAPQYHPPFNPSVVALVVAPINHHKTNVAKGKQVVFEATHAKFMKMIRLDFLKYFGEGDPTYWIRQSEQFFYCHEVAYEDQVEMATFHLEGHTQLWYKILCDDEINLYWEEFCDRLYERFNPSDFDNFTGELVNLRQTGTVLEYQKQFKVQPSKFDDQPKIYN